MSPQRIFDVPNENFFMFFTADDVFAEGWWIVASD